VSDAKSSSATGTTGTAESPRPYCGRFAPSPTGPLHFGSLVAAVGSYLDARAAGGRWLLRIEDLDLPRTRPGAEARILADLESLGFAWDGPVRRQSERSALYEQALARLQAAGLCFECACTRSELAALALRPGAAESDEAFHPAACPPRPMGTASALGRALRFHVPPGEVCFDDRAQGRVCRDVAMDIGSFVIRRRDGLYAYQFAVVVDDALQGVTHVVRGADLLDSTPRQLLLQRALGLPASHYLHLPLAVRADGAKLSKSANAPSLDDRGPAPLLWAVLEFLRQSPPAELAGGPVGEVWAWATSHWAPQRFAGERARRVDLADTQGDRRAR
jgi:glutamyl-Q tRNA(Asp) synthetase